MRKFDINNDGNLTGNYPLFFGKPLGLFDTFNNPYPELEELDDNQQALFWPAKEISLVQDAADIEDMDNDILDLLIENLSFQMAGDSRASGTISALFLPILSNNSAVSLVEYWSMTESTHARAYLRIIAEAFKDPNELLERIKSNSVMLSRLDFLTENFIEHEKMLKGVQYDNLYEKDPSYCRKTTIKTIVSLLSFEAIMFLGSFANTFALCEATQKINGIGKIVGLIHDDEAISHKNNGLAFLKIIKDKEKWKEWETTLPEVKGILDRVVKQELEWCVHQFTKCKSLVGFNVETLKDFQLYLARDLYMRLGVPYDFKVVDVNPFSGWMSKYTKADMKQVAAQESETSNYLTGASLDDVGHEDFDF